MKKEAAEEELPLSLTGQSTEQTEGERGGLEKIEEWFFAGLLLSMVVLGLIPILARSHAGALVSWADPLTRHMVLWLTLFGAATASAKRKHIAIDAICPFLSARAGRAIHGGGEFLAACICVLLAVFGGRFVFQERAFSSVQFWGIQEWVLQLVLPLGFAWIAFRLLVAAWEDIRSSWRGDSATKSVEPS